MIFTYGLSSSQGSTVDVIIENNFGLVLEVSLRFEFLTTNNQTGYEAINVGIIQALESSRCFDLGK